MNGLLERAAVLFVIWILALLVLKTVGGAVYLVFLVAVVMLVHWLIRRVRGG